MAQIDAAIYCGGPLYAGGPAVIDDLRSSGFTSVVGFALHVEADGDLVFNGPPAIVADGEYVGDPLWPARLAELKQGGSVRRLSLSIGGWGVGDFPNIQALIQRQGTGPETILARNFGALKAALAAVDTIDFDDETLYDANTTIAFATLLHRLGFDVTFCPYMNAAFWTNCLGTLWQARPGAVTGFNLQCYAGGASNDPAEWIQAIQGAMGPEFPAAAFVKPGLWSRHGSSCSEGDCPSEAEKQFASWRSAGITGGFIWLYDDIEKCLNSSVCGAPPTAQAYAAAIIGGLTGSSRGVIR